MDVLAGIGGALRSGSSVRYFVGGRLDALRAMLFGALRIVRQTGTWFTSISNPAATLRKLTMRFQHIRMFTTASFAPSRSDCHFAYAMRVVRR